MFYSVLLDLNLTEWESKDQLINLQIYINALLLSKNNNQVKLISNKEVIYNSEDNKNLEEVLQEKIREINLQESNNINNQNGRGSMNPPEHQSQYRSLTNNFNSYRVTPSDLGYALIDKPDSILIYEMSKENPQDYLNYLKCMFVAQNRNIKINGYSLKKNNLIKMVTEGSGGIFLENYSLKDLFKTTVSMGMGSMDSICCVFFKMNCLCCDKQTSLGMVCPICLAVYCKFTPVCKRCKTKFSFIK
jgi:transcription initiation factor TFIIH subunit 3